MEIEVKQPQLKSALKTVANAIPSTTSMPILKSVKLVAKNDNLKLETTDLEIGINTKISAKVLSEGSVCVPAKVFANYIKECAKTKPVRLKVLDSDNLDIKCGASHTELQGNSIDNFPDQPELKSDIVKFNGEKFKDMLKKTKFAASEDEAKPFLNGVYLEFGDNELKTVTTDTYRLSYKNNEVDTDINTNFILPTVTADTLEKEIGSEVKFMFDENNNLIKFKDGKTIITSRLISGDFPNYNQVIPEGNGTKFTIEKDKFKSAIKRTLVTNEDDNIIVFEFDNGLKISNKQSETGQTEEQLEGEVEGESYRTALNGKYLLDFLKQANEEIEMISQGKETPVLIKNKDDNSYKYVVMPVRAT